MPRFCVTEIRFKMREVEFTTYVSFMLILRYTLNFIISSGEAFEIDLVKISLSRSGLSSFLMKQHKYKKFFLWECYRVRRSVLYTKFWYIVILYLYEIAECDILANVHQIDRQRNFCWEGKRLSKLSLRYIGYIF